MFVLVHFTAKSFGKVEPNLASTPSLECLRQNYWRNLWFDLTIDCRNVRAEAKLCLQRHSQLLFKSFSSHFPPRIKKPFWEFLKNWNVFDYQRGPSWFEYSSAALETYRIFSHAGFRQKCRMASKKSSQKQLLQFTAPKAKNRQNFAGGRPPGVFIEA